MIHGIHFREFGIRKTLCKRSSESDGDREISREMDDQRRHADVGQKLTDISSQDADPQTR